MQNGTREAWIDENRRGKFIDFLRKSHSMMAEKLNTEPNLAAPDDFYEALIDAHRGLTEVQSQSVNAKLILLLANHIGDLDVLREAIAAARGDIDEAR